MVAIRSIEIYYIQFNGIPLKLCPCLDLYTSDVTENVAVPHLGGSALIYLHIRLHCVAVACSELF